jgi:hypothetical protein
MMNEDEDDKEIQRLIESVENMRAQNSAEHAKFDAKLGIIERTVLWLKARWEKFSK